MLMSSFCVVLICVAQLPSGPSPDPLLPSHFPERLHAFVWRNWNLVPTERLAEVVQTSPEAILRVGNAMGLPAPPMISENQLERTYITIIRANWHLLPYSQLLTLLGWTESKLAFTLREDDFLYIKLGSLKPNCTPLLFSEPDAAAAKRCEEIAAVLKTHFDDNAGCWVEPPLTFIEKLSAPPAFEKPPATSESIFNPRFCYSYFALYGDPLLEQDPFPEGYLQRLAAAGVNGVWLHAVLYKLSPFPWQSALSEGWEQRLDRLKALVQRAAAHGIQVFLYLNEPRAMPVQFFEEYPDLRGVQENDYASMCTSAPEVRSFLTEATARICAVVPDLGGFFTITVSENLTNCWSHHRGAECARCSPRGAAEVIAEVHDALAEGIRQAGSNARLIAWDWGWQDDWALELISKLPETATLMSVSEWNVPILRGGIAGSVGEYSISAVGPGPRALRHWEWARERNLPAFAKIQANTTWELGALPYIPATANVARHVAALREAGVSGLMLGWTLGGCPSPNLEVVQELGKRNAAGAFPTVEEAMHCVAVQRFGAAAADVVVESWKIMSDAFSEFPYGGGVVYNAPLQAGPANPLWRKPTGYRATMVGIPYDDLEAWRGQYPPEIFIGQLRKAADGFKAGSAMLQNEVGDADDPSRRTALEEEARLAEAAAIHFYSVANQSEFVWMRNRIQEKEEGADAARLIELMEAEIALAKGLYDLQRRDSRIGFEATNHYFYTPADLVEKVVGCTFLLEQETGR